MRRPLNAPARRDLVRAIVHTAGATPRADQGWDWKLGGRAVGNKWGTGYSKLKIHQTILPL